MSIEKVNVERIKCDHCGQIRYANEDGIFESGYEVSVTAYAPGGAARYTVVACKLAHISHAAKVGAEKWRQDREMDAAAVQETPYDNGGELPAGFVSGPVTPELSADWASKP